MVIFYFLLQLSVPYDIVDVLIADRQQSVHFKEFKMASKKYDAVVYVLRAQPLHKGHIETIRRASDLAHKVILIVGSAFRPRDTKNPFTYDERRKMIIGAIDEYGLDVLSGAQFCIHPIMDTLYDDTAWVSNVQKIVFSEVRPQASVAIIGHEKDESSFYLKMFPCWSFENQGLIEPLDATQLRQLYFGPKMNINLFSSVISYSTREFLDRFSSTAEYAEIVRERQFIDAYRKQYESLPYPPVFVTVDAVVVQSAHVLLVKRRSAPGKGLWALPGGFLNAGTDRSVAFAMLRELREETAIKVPDKVLSASVAGSRVFDAVGRSTRGRTITHAFHIDLQGGDGSLPKVKGSDDAVKAQWVPLAKVNPECLYEDHYDIITYFTGSH